MPTLHLGGTARDTLFEDTIDALDALRDALRALDVTNPNTRDYPKPGEITQAIAQHLDRKRRIESVISELEALAEHIKV
jgi:alpha-ketoglutarate-dependent taurine dioxygenase